MPPKKSPEPAAVLSRHSSRLGEASVAAWVGAKVDMSRRSFGAKADGAGSFPMHRDSRRESAVDKISSLHHSAHYEHHASFM